MTDSQHALIVTEVKRSSHTVIRVGLPLDTTALFL